MVEMMQWLESKNANFRLTCWMAAKIWLMCWMAGMAAAALAVSPCPVGGEPVHTGLLAGIFQPPLLPS